jgi:hypothetical protein
MFPHSGVQQEQSTCLQAAARDLHFNRLKEDTSMIPDTVNRVAENTADDVNERIRADTDVRVRELARHGAAAIAHRLRELDQEWDIERVLEANAASASLAGSLLALTVDRRWLLLPIAVGGFLLQHAVQGWCPPLLWFRRLGVRTAQEIEHERNALKALRGDYLGVTASSAPAEVIRAARA